MTNQIYRKGGTVQREQKLKVRIQIRQEAKESEGSGQWERTRRVQFEDENMAEHKNEKKSPGSVVTFIYDSDSKSHKKNEV